MPYSMQLTEQIPNDPPGMGAKIITISNHPSRPTGKFIYVQAPMMYDFMILY